MSKIIKVQLQDHHYRAVKAIFKDTFDPTRFQISSLNISWYNRSKEESYAFFLEGKLIGFIITSFHVKSKSNIYVDYIAFDKAYRGRGLGSQALSEMLQEIKKQNRSVHLYPERPELWAWYERLGFQETHDGYLNFHSYATRSKF